MKFDSPLTLLPKTSGVTIKKFKNLGIETIGDLISYFPTRYEDYNLVSPIAKLQVAEIVTIKGQLLEFRNQYTRRRGFTIQKALVKDNTGTISLNWYNQPYLANYFKAGDYIFVSGKVEEYKGTLMLEPKSFEKVVSLNQPAIHTSRLVPIYPEKRGLSSKTIREKIYLALQGLEEMPETLPPQVISYNELISLPQAYRTIHFPINQEEILRARRRLGFDELFMLQLKTLFVRLSWDREKVGRRLEVEKHKKQIDKFMTTLPFSLTTSQKKVLQEIISDLKKDKPMNRFLQGEVGSGKTIVAAIAAFITYLNGYQSYFMAPTEILAQQHYQTLKDFFKNHPLKIILVTSSKKEKHDDAHIVIGTHALLHRSLDPSKIGFVVVDEQHRFGVKQRNLLKEKGLHPHLLTMTATPIPRTVALVLYGELDVSTIDSLPHGRLPVKTYLVPPHKREDGYEWIKKRIKEREQVFIVCPLIEESKQETMKSIKAAKREFEYLSTEIFKDFTCELIHGKMKGVEKNEVMARFKEKKTDILVATSLVEVGIDIPDATVMVIEGAERYGLAQLHQLRGRVGRGAKQSYCFIFTDSKSPDVVERLKFFTKTLSGSELSEYDLRRRGAGQLYGTSQHGFSSLQVADITDLTLMIKVKHAVSYFLQNYKDMQAFPSLAQKLEGLDLEFIGPN